MPQDGAPHPEFVVIHTYTRREAIADGVLVDATVGELAEVTRQHFKIHVAMTAEVHALLERAVENPRYHNDYRGVWHDVCSLLRTTITRAARTSEQPPPELHLADGDPILLSPCPSRSRPARPPRSSRETDRRSRTAGTPGAQRPPSQKAMQAWQRDDSLRAGHARARLRAGERTTLQRDLRPRPTTQAHDRYVR